MTTEAPPFKLSLEVKRAARAACRGEYRTISRGRSRHSAGVTNSTPIRWIEGDSPPELRGQPYLKTGFNNGRGFSMTLYTPSTLRIVVGKNWKPTPPAP